MDVAIAAVFVLAGQVTTWWRLDDAAAFAGPRPLNAVVSLLLMSALAWRRRAPLVALCWAVAVYCLPHLVVPLDTTFLTGFIPLIILTASAGYAASRPRAIVAAAVAMVGLVAVTVSSDILRSWDALAFNSMFLLVPWIGARALKGREDRAGGFATELETERASKDVALRAAAAAERSHIARELHDIVAHNVSMMVIQIGAARMQLQIGLAGAEGAGASLLDAEEAGRQTLDDLRRLLGVLRADEAADAADAAEAAGAPISPEPPQPGLAQLKALVAPIRATGLQVEVDVAGDPVALPTALDLTVYRIVQEALTNTLKHSGATSADVRLTYKSSTLLIDVVDDGTPRPAGDRTGHGLVGIGERAALFGGTVTAGAAEGGGWRVQAELPLPARAVRHGLAKASPTA
jgi:signal transduction histidine kinase